MRWILALGLMAALCVAAAAWTWLGHRHLVERVSRLESRVSQEKTSLESMIQSTRENERKNGMILHAQEFAWTGGLDSPLQGRLVSGAEVVRVGDPVHLLVEIRNVSDRTQTVSGLRFAPFLIQVYRDSEIIKYHGPQPRIAPPIPVTLPPGWIIRSSMVLTTRAFPELAQPGQYTVEWTYTSPTPDGKTTWSGELPLSVSWEAK